jgi:hypothetical protein
MSYSKFLVGFDPHGDKQHEATNDVFFKFAAMWKPDIRICGGDVWDFRPLRKGACEAERKESMREDFAAGKKWLQRFFEPDAKRKFFLRGNHDERLWELAEDDKGIFRDHASDGIREITTLNRQHGVNMLPYHKREGVLRIGHLKVLHGFYCGVTAARQHALTYQSCLFGHVHAIDEAAVPGLDRRVSRCCGALCELDMDYNSRMPNTLRQAHGFAYGIINDRTGEYHVWQAEEVGGRWLLPSDIVEVKA